MGCQTDIAKAIRNKVADYLLSLKDNWPVLSSEVERFFADPKATGLERHETVDGDHGRIEVRRHTVCHSVDGLTSDRRFPGDRNQVQAFAAHGALWLLREALLE